MSRLTLHLLGPPLIDLDGQPVQLGRHKAVALLVYLALTRQPHSRDALATLLWPELDQSHARGQLRRTLSLLNRTLGEEWLAVDRETVEWAPDAEAWVDVEVFRERLAACAAHRHPPQETCPDCIPLLTEAVNLYRDGFLAGFTLPDAPAFDEWQFFEGEGLRDEVSDALQRLARWHGDRGEYDAAISYARRWLALDLLHEPAHRELMSLYARSGQRAAALRQYDECRRVLQEELDVPPSPETTELYEAIRAGRALPPEVSPAGVVAPEPFSLRQHNLPEQLTPFVGREKELAELSDLLSPSAEARLVTVVGPGGMGKTRLALEAASRQLESYPDGVWFVPLTSVQSAEAIAPTVAQVLGVSFHGPDPPDQQLLRYLRDKRMLIVLDNLEHLLEGVDPLVEILHSAPGVHLLITSRVRLNVMGEQLFALQGMNYPGSSLAGDLRAYDAVALFAQSAQRVRPGFALNEEQLRHVARVCQLAQGMPLAILLAAAWVPALTLAEIAVEMERSLDFLAADWRGAPERHHNMRAVLDATWGMLAKDERQAFARLSVFRGGFTREAAEAVAGAGLRTLISLVSKSLLQCDQSGRYQIHELLRQYAEEKLEGSEETLDLHAAYYAQFLAGRETDLLKGYLDESLREIDNIRAAWRRLTAHAHLAEIHKCLYSLHSLYQGPGLFQEGEAVFAAAVDALQPGPGEDLDDERAAAWGLALVMQGYFAAWFGHVDRAVERTEQGLSILHRLGDRRELAVANILAVGARAWTDTSRARQLLEESLVISQRLQLVSDQAQGRGGLAFIAMVEGAYREAEQHAQEALAVWRRTDHRYNAAIELAMLGHAARGLGEYERARECYEEGLTLFREAHQSWGVGRMYSHLGDVAMAVGDYDQARECHRNALARYQDEGFYWVELSAIIGGSWGVPVSLQRLGDVALAVGDRQGARQHYGQSVQMAIDHPYIELQLYVPLGPARLLAQEGRTEQAVQLAALARHHPAGVEETRDKAGELLDKLRSEMSPEIYAAAEARGRARDLEATMWELLEELGS